MTQGLRIVVTGLIAQHRFLGGVAWGVLNWIFGLRSLGHDVYYVEDSGQWPYNLDGGPLGDDWIAMDCAPNVAHLADVMARCGLADKWGYRFPIRHEWYGLSETRRNDLLRSADMLLNVSGTIENPEEYRKIPRLVYVDTDPVFTQIEVVNGETDLLKRRVDAHDLHFTFGECLSSDVVPATGHDWLPIRTPIPLAEWRTAIPHRGVFTTVMNWTSYRPVSYGGRTYGQKDAEFLPFLELPRLVAATRLEVALPKVHHRDWQTVDTDADGGARDGSSVAPHDLLARSGWRVVDAIPTLADPDRYRSYIQSSMAEWSIAKSGYVRGRAGWFSNRSATYLAAGRPVVVQDTGFGPVLPVGEGILTFTTLREAVAAIREVEGRYARHAAAAAEIAEAYFDSNRILNGLLDRVFCSDVC